MATRDAKLRVAVEGEQAYKQALGELNKGSQVLSSEMKKLTAEFEGNEKSIEALTAKGDLLQRELLQQKDKVDVLKKAVAESAKNFGEADKRTQEWQIKLNNAEAAEFKLQKQLDATNKEIEDQSGAIEEVGKNLPKLGDQIDSVTQKFGISLPGGIKDSLNNIEGFSSGSIVALGAVAAAVGAIEIAWKGVQLAIEGAQKLHKITLEEGAWADDLLTRSAQTGLSTDLLQGLDYASKFLDFEGIDKSINKLTLSMDKARDGAQSQAQAFEMLGVSVTTADGQLRDNWTTFLEVIDALGRIRNETEADAIANDIFGKSYADLKPLIDAGSGSLSDLIDHAQEAGYILGEEQIQTLGDVDDAYQEYQEQIELTKKKLAVEFAPVSQEVMTQFGEFAMRAGQTLIESGLLEKLSAFLEPLGEIMDSLLTLAAVILPGLTRPLQIAADLFGAVADAVSWLADELSRVDWGQASSMSNSQEYGWGINAAGDQNWRGGLTWVGESGPELVSLPRGTQIHTAQESRQIAGGDTYYNITVANVQELSEIVDWYESRRIRGRMA